MNERTRSLIGGEVKSTCAGFEPLSQSSYPKEVQDCGFSLDLTSIVRGYYVGMRRATEGSRNNRLFRFSIELVRCGVDPALLEDAGVATGLGREEVRRTISSAIANYSDQYGESVLAFVLRWREHQVAKFALRYKTLIDRICAAAVAQNTTSPMINQSSLNLSADRTTAGRWLQTMCTRNALKKKAMGRRPNGLSRSNCYELLMPHDTVRA
jgi:hypothetical protein